MVSIASFKSSSIQLDVHRVHFRTIQRTIGFYNHFTVCLQFMKVNCNISVALKLSSAFGFTELHPFVSIVVAKKKKRWRRPKCQTQGFKTVVRKATGDVAVFTSTSYSTVYCMNMVTVYFNLPSLVTNGLWAECFRQYSEMD